MSETSPLKEGESVRIAYTDGRVSRRQCRSLARVDCHSTSGAVSALYRDTVVHDRVTPDSIDNFYRVTPKHRKVLYLRIIRLRHPALTFICATVAGIILKPETLQNSAERVNIKFGLAPADRVSAPANWPGLPIISANGTPGIMLCASAKSDPNFLCHGTRCPSQYLHPRWRWT